jgi:hypothetical protein
MAGVAIIAGRIMAVQPRCGRTLSQRGVVGLAWLRFASQPVERDIAADIKKPINVTEALDRAAVTGLF